MKIIKVTLEDRVYVDFISYAGGKGKGSLLLREWVNNYVMNNNEKDLQILENNRIKKEAFNRSI